MKKIDKSRIKTWFVTGASSGVGYEACSQLLAKGYNVVAVSRRLAHFEHPNVFCISADVSEYGGCRFCCKKRDRAFWKSRCFV
ncbi:MAG: SDR family NAD(P)-dependent oxidoreductase [Alphaproteobacteria bacterium]